MRLARGVAQARLVCVSDEKDALRGRGREGGHDGDGDVPVIVMAVTKTEGVRVAWFLLAQICYCISKVSHT